MIWKVQGSSSEFRVRETGDVSVLEDDGQTERSRGLLYLYNATRSPKPRGFLKVGSRQSPLGSRQSAVDTRQSAVGLVWCKYFIYTKCELESSFGL
jgi:hypothetical protein